MPVERYFIEKSLQAGETCELSGAEFHHLAHVAAALADTEECSTYDVDPLRSRRECVGERQPADERRDRLDAHAALSGAIQ